MASRLLSIIALSLVIFSFASVTAQENTVCCEQTSTGAFCQNVPQTACAEGSRSAPTSCESTSFCRTGTCYDSNEGTCLGNTPQIVCNQNGGVWSLESPPQCNLGCCMLGDQASFTTLVRCKVLSSFLGLETNYNNAIKSEVACIAEVQSKEKGACVYDSEFERNCKYTTRDECKTGINGIVGEFFSDKLCSAEELGTTCGPTTQTTCGAGGEFYFLDTCGNIANIYDASKVEDKNYWSVPVLKSESCNPNSPNADSRNCGNCNYLLGSICRNEEAVGTSPSYGDYICADLNCNDNGLERRHGESWCVKDESIGFGKADVGTRFGRQVCLNGQIITEACADFRNEECVEDKIETDVGPFSQAACRVNRWQDCLAQTEKPDCENSDRRDCYWQEGIELPAIGNSSENGGVCLPVTPPGLNFWEDQEASTFCNVANTQCVVKFEKGLFGGEDCVENCECLDETWEKERADICRALGDCGPKLNWLGKEQRGAGFEIIKS